MAHPPQSPVAARCRVLRQPVRLLVASLALVLATPTLAVELGRLRVLSGIGQPLHLEFPLQEIASGATASDYAAQVQAQVAQNTALQAAQPWPAQIEIHPATNGGLVAVVRSEASVAQPAVGLQLQLEGPDGAYRKQVVVLLPSAERAVAPALRLALALGHTDAARLAANGIGSRGGNASGGQRAARSRASTAAAGPRATLRVARGDTLSSIVSRLQREGQHGDASAQQLMQALLQDNPDAFIRGNLHGLKAGAELQLPDADTLASIDTAEARRLVEDHDASWAVSRSAGRAPVVAERTPSAQAATGRVSAAPAAAPAAARDELRLSAASGRGSDAQGAIDQLRDERAATAQAIAEAQSRSGTLAANVAELQLLLQAQDAVLARLGEGAATPGSATPGNEAAVSADAPAAAADAGTMPSNVTAAVASGTLAANGQAGGSGTDLNAGLAAGTVPNPTLANGTLVASAAAGSGLGVSAGLAPIAPSSAAPVVSTSASPWLWAGIGLLVLLVAAVLAWLLRGQRSPHDDDVLAGQYLDGITLDLDPPASRSSQS